MHLRGLLALVGVGACSLAQQDLPNESPVLEAAIIDTTQVARGGRVEVAVRASDEDDDLLSYVWRDSLAGGTFTESNVSRTTWTAPLSLDSFDPSLLTSVTLQGQTCRAIEFPLSVLILDRQCGLVPALQDSLACERLSQASQITVSDPFTVTVVQCIPLLSAPADTTVSCCPEVTLNVVGSDPDGDQLEYSWEQLEGAPLSLRGLGEGEVQFDSETPGEYLLQASATDGSDTTRVEITVYIQDAPANPPQDG
ncbi:MAG: hypothetical protein GKR89_28890 [Candidatus Latescibacteria bacterium]|nr:hypothetical protein [Candidatus Latescibacterota bacterium]